MEKEFKYIEGHMLIAYLTAYCCGIGVPAAGLCDHARDFDRASEACAGGVSEGQGDRKSVLCNQVMETGMSVLTGHE